MNASRRLFLAALSAATLVLSGCATSPSTGTGASFRGPVGLQLYSLRGHFTKNVPSTLDIVKGYGVHEVELAGTYGQTPEKFRQELTLRGLVPISGHFPYKRFQTDPEGIAKEAKALGLKYAGCAWIDHKGSFDAQQARDAAAVFNKAGEILAKHGIRCFYHCHGFEFEPGAAGPGIKAMDILIKETDPRWMAFEMDILWITFPGEDAAAWLAKYPGRWELLHLKDLKKGVATGFHNGGTDPNNDVTLGTGQMDWPKILAAAKKSGVKHYFIEDESADSVNQIPRTLKHLEGVRW